MNRGTAYDWLARHAAISRSSPAVLTWRDGDHSRLTYGELWAQANGVAAGLSRAGVRPGDRVALSLPNGPSFVIALVACLARGAIAVPAPVLDAMRSAAAWDRLVGITADCAPTLIMTSAIWADGIRTRMAGSHSDVTVVAYEVLAARGGVPTAPPGSRCEVAVLQYTSGSTSRPRGVVVTHEMVRASCAQASAVYGEGHGDVAVTWVPLYHDMGLVTAVMRPLYTGYPTVLLHPHDFIRNPVTWLEAIHECGGTLSSAPNFAYDLVVRKTTTAQLRGLDLSRWRIARNAGEVVLPQTLDRFATHLAPTGFRATSLCPSYGLAEATLAVTTCGPTVRPNRVVVDREALERGVVRPCGPNDGTPVRELVSSGKPLPDTQVRIDRGAENEPGEVMILGPQVTHEYWGSGNGSRGGPGGWRRTGDVGFLRDGQLFVLGRNDDTLVLHGRNYHANDVTVACADIPGLRAGRVAAFLPETSVEPVNRVVLVAELNPSIVAEPAYLEALASRVRQRMVSALELYIGDIAFVPPGALPVTTSGKVRTSEARRRYCAGTLPLVTSAAARSRVTT